MEIQILISAAKVWPDGLHPKLCWLGFKGHDGNLRQFAEVLSPVLWTVILGDIDPVIDKITRLEAPSPPLTH